MLIYLNATHCVAIFTSSERLQQQQYYYQMTTAAAANGSSKGLSFLSAFAKLRKATINFVMSVCDLELSSWILHPLK
jgi:alpha-D-ribose 1-methylphosphonate 5-triphosphate synthase subunit PhnH